MFQLRAGFSEQVEWKTTAAAARACFNDFKNFVELMPGVERITADAQGIARWLIRADVPVVGAIRQAFSVEQSVDEPSCIEWSPAEGERRNFLRYVATFEERGETTRIRVEQRVELRRQNARERGPTERRHRDAPGLPQTRTRTARRSGFKSKAASSKLSQVPG